MPTPNRFSLGAALLLLACGVAGGVLGSLLFGATSPSRAPEPARDSQAALAAALESLTQQIEALRGELSLRDGVASASQPSAPGPSRQRTPDREPPPTLEALNKTLERLVLAISSAPAATGRTGAPIAHGAVSPLQTGKGRLIERPAIARALQDAHEFERR